MKNRFFCLLLSVMLLFGTFNLNVGAAEEFPKEEYEFLKVIGIGDLDISNPDRHITRGEFASLVVKIAGLSDVSFDNFDVEDPFYDVRRGHKFFNSIKVLKDLKVIRGDIFGNFYPEENISTIDSLVMIINLLGYQPYAEAQGGYSAGYYMMASQSMLTKDVNLSAALLDLKNAVKLIYNALFIDVVNKDGITYDGDVKLSQSDRSVLSTYHNIDYMEGTLLNDGFISLNGDYTDEGKILVKDKKTGYILTLDCESSKVYGYIGCDLRFYIDQNDKSGKTKVIHASPTTEISKTTISADTIVDVNPNYIEYEKEDGKFDKIKFSSNNPYVIKNGTKIVNWNYDDFYSDSGIITFTGHNEGNIDVVEIIHFSYNIITDYSSSEKKRLTCKLSPMNNLDFSDEENCVYRIDKDGKIGSLDDVVEYDIVSVAKGDRKVNGKDFYILYTGSSDIEETFVAYSDNHNKILSDSKEYKMSKGYLSIYPTYYSRVALGKPITFRMDCTGKIAYIMTQDTGAIHYCYLINISNEHPVEPLSIFYYDGENSIKESIISSKIVIDDESTDGKLIDGESASFYEEIIELLSRRQDGSVLIPDDSYHAKYNKSSSKILPKPAIIKVNGKNEVTYIDTAYSSSLYEGEEEDPYKLKSTTERIFRNKAYYSTIGSFDSQYFITSDTVILKVADIDRYGMDSYSIVNTNRFETDIYDINNYKKINASELNKSSAYDAQAYNVNLDTGIVDLLIIRGDATLPYYQSYSYGAQFLVFVKLTEVYDASKDEIVYRLYYKDADEEKNVLVDKDTLHPFYNNIIFGGEYPQSITSGFMGTEKVEEVVYKDVEPLSEGDIISIGTKNGYLTHIQRDIDLSLINEKAASSFRPAAPQNPYGNHVFSKSNIGFPFDQRYLVQTDNLSNTYQCELLLPINVFSDTIKVGIPYNSHLTALGNYGNYINSGFDQETLYTKFIKSNPDMKITLVEETEYNISTKKSKVTISSGTLSDIKSLSEYGPELSSRIYAYGVSGKYTQMVILNLLAEHNKDI